MTLEEFYYVSQIVVLLPVAADFQSALPVPTIKDDLEARAPRSAAAQVAVKGV